MLATTTQKKIYLLLIGFSVFLGLFAYGLGAISSDVNWMHVLTRCCLIFDICLLLYFDTMCRVGYIAAWCRVCGVARLERNSSSIYILVNLTGICKQFSIYPYSDLYIMCMCMCVYVHMFYMCCTLAFDFRL